MKKGTKVKWVLKTGGQREGVVEGGLGTVITDEEDGHVLVQKEGTYLTNHKLEPVYNIGPGACVSFLPPSGQETNIETKTALEEHIVIRCAVTWLTVQN